MIFGAPAEAYEVEFVDAAGDSMGNFTVPADHIEIAAE